MRLSLPPETFYRFSMTFYPACLLQAREVICNAAFLVREREPPNLPDGLYNSSLGTTSTVLVTLQLCGGLVFVSAYRTAETIA